MAFQKARHVLPVTATDLMQRALAKFVNSDATSPASSLSSNTMILPPIGLAPQTPPQRTNMEVARLARSITVEPIAKKTNKHEGGDYDDKMDRFTLSLKFTNTDNGAGAENLKAEVYIFGQSIMNTSVRKVLGVENFTFSLPPRGSHEVKTTEVTTRFDKTGARFGYEYDSWFLRVVSSTGEVVMIKASAPSLMQNAAKITGLQANSAFERSTFAAVANPPR